MNWQTVLVICALLISTAVGIGMSIFAMKRRFMPGSLPFIALTLALAEWSLTYALEIGADNLAAKTVWAQFQYIGIATVGPAWWTFTRGYTRREIKYKLWHYSIFVVVPTITVIMAFTNSLHGWFWSSIELNTDGPLRTFDASYGYWWWIFFVYSYTLILWGSLTLFQAIRSFAAIYRGQFIILLFGLLLPWLGNVLYIARLSPIPQLDLGPFAFTISVMISGIGMRNYRMFDLFPVTRSAVIDRLESVAFVLDWKERIVDLNLAAGRLSRLSPAAGLERDAAAGNPHPSSEPIIIDLSTHGHLSDEYAREFIGKPVAEVYDWWGQVSKNSAEAMESQETISLLTDGVRRYYALQITPLWNARGQLTGRLAVMRDVTTDHLAENALALARVKTEFLAKVGHELRTPLTSLLGITEMLAANVFGPLSGDQQEAVGLMSTSVNNMVRLVNDLLQQTRLERGTFGLEESNFAVAVMVDRLRETLKPKALAKGLALIIELTPEVPPKLYGDSLRLYQILLNLGENAIKYTLAGHILIRIFCQADKHLIFQVADTGIGVPEEMQDYIFNAFQQGKYAPELEKGGLGLGLSIVTQLVELMKGELTLKSETGKGSVFTVTLPLRTASEENL